MILISTNITLAAPGEQSKLCIVRQDCPTNLCTWTPEQCYTPPSTTTTTTNPNINWWGSTCAKDSDCKNGETCQLEWPTGNMKCTQITTTSNTNTTTEQSINGITINDKCLLNGQCKFNIYDTLGIRKSVRDNGDPTSVGLFVQDIVLSATMFIWSVVTLGLIVSGLMYIFAAASGKDPSKAKKGISSSLIGLLIVSCSYFIIRLVQYIAKGM